MLAVRRDSSSTQHWRRRPAYTVTTLHNVDRGRVFIQGKVVIASASSLSIVLLVLLPDSPSTNSLISLFSTCSHQASGEVDIASNEEMSDHYKNLSSTNSDNHKKLTRIIPGGLAEIELSTIMLSVFVVTIGNTVHYRVKLKASSEANRTCCSFTVTGTQMGRCVALFCQRLF